MDHLLVSTLTAIMMFFLVVGSFQALLLMFAVPELWSHWQLTEDEYFQSLVGAEALPPISVIAPLVNVERDAVDFAQMLLDLEYPRHEVVLVNDGSTDDTLGVLVRAFDLYEVPPAFTVSLQTSPVRGYYRSRTHPRLLCIDKEQGGAGDSMNAGLNATRYPHVLVASCDVAFAQDALLRLTRPFLLDRSVAVVACSLRAANGGRVEHGQFVPGTIRGWVAGCQTIEYLRNFLLQRLGWNRLASNIVFPGSTAIFKREHVFAVGGFRRDLSTPTLDVAVRLHRGLADMGINPRMQVIPDQIAWTTVPETLGGIARARRRWQRGLWRALRGNLGLFANPEFGAFGLLAIPYFWIAIILAPFLELIGYVGLVAGIARGALDAPFVVAYLAVAVGYGMLLSIWTVIIQALMFQRTEHRVEITRLFAFAVFESFGYRQIMAWFRASAYFIDRSPSHNHG